MTSFGGSTALALGPHNIWGNSISSTTFTIDASTKLLAWIFSAEKTETLTRVGFDVSAFASAPQYKVSIQGVSTTKQTAPDATIKGGGSPASATFTPIATGWRWYDLANSLAVTAGDMLALVIEYDSGTIGASNDATFIVDQFRSAFGMCFPQSTDSTDSGTTWTNSAASAWPAFAYGAAGTVRGYPVENLQSNTLATTTANSIHANKFTIPDGVTDKINCIGLDWFGQYTVAASDTVRFGIYDSSGHASPLAETKTVTKDEIDSSAGQGGRIHFTSGIELLPGSTYYAGARLISGDLRTVLQTMDVAADMAAYPFGTACFHSAWAPSAWTDAPTQRQFFNLVIEGMTEPAGGGGGTVNLLRGKL